MGPKTYTVIVLCLFAAAALAVATIMGGDGSIERMTTLRGIYSVCKPGGYPAVCFGEAGVEGVSCVPFTGECR